MTKKKWRMILATSMLLVGIAGCKGNESTGSSDSSKTEIRFINGFTGGDGAYMTKIVDGFNKSQEKYKVIQSQEKDYYTKFKSSQYDLVVIHESNLDTYVKDNMIQPVTTYMDKADLKESDFHKAGIDSTTVNGKMYGVPLDIHPLTMFYNKEYVKSEPKTYDDLKRSNAEVQSINKNLYTLGLPSTGLVEFYMTTIAAQNNINLVKDNYLNFAQEPFADALMTYHNMVFEDKMSPPKLGLDAEFQTFMKSANNDTKQSVVSLTGPWYFQALKEKFGDQLGIGTIPQLGEKIATTGNAHTLAIPTNVKDEKVKAGIEQFLKYMYTPEHLANWAEAGQTPTHLATLNFIQENPNKYELASKNLSQLDHYVSMPHVYLYSEQMRYMSEVVFSKLVGDKDFTKDKLMTELETATKKAKSAAATSK
ncbi:extracellular solute-binding protein [Bacillus thuringiensis]|uniref:extracellular solute-binding protein n=1 Tax=Bacillus thuringiensis TaxID=1428 RepID=UPI0033356930